MRTLKTGIVVLALLSSATLSTAVPDRLGSLVADKREIHCLAQNIYHEARGESVEGQLAVAQVTVNRVQSKKFQATVCDTVYARRQFSWTLKKHRSIKDSKAWDAAVVIATAVLTQTAYIPNFKALYFHTRQVRPYWKYGKRVAATIGNHIFYN